MNAYQKLLAIQKKNSSSLCVGLDIDLAKLPASFERKAASISEFNRLIIEATQDLACAYKINVAFYEQYGIEGLQAMEETLRHVPENILTICDAKRGDIGNTSRAYAVSVFEHMNFDTVTVNPYMGRDSVEPFLEFENKLVFLLALTSNPGSADFQRLEADGKAIYTHVIERSMQWADHERLGFVVGATHPGELAEIRKTCTRNILLIPGVGAQGADPQSTMEANGDAPAVVNVSRGIMYASAAGDFVEKARQAALHYKESLGAGFIHS